MLQLVTTKDCHSCLRKYLTLTLFQALLGFSKNFKIFETPSYDVRYIFGRVWENLGEFGKVREFWRV